MKKRRWIWAAAVFFGLLLAALGIFALGYGNEGSYVSPSSPGTEKSEAAEEPQEIFIQNENEEEAREDAPVRLVFAGDILLSDHVLNAYSKGGGIRGILDSGFQKMIDESDIFMANEEFPFSSRGTAAEDKQFTFRLPPKNVSIFQEMGIDIVTLANNHTLDFGTEALMDTCDTLDQAEIYHVGAGRNLEEAKQPAVLTAKGKKIGFLGASRVIPVASWNAAAAAPGLLTTYDPTLLLEEIRTLKETCDYVVVYVHWGIERSERPEAYQRSLGQQYIDAGADLVIGSHPHVLQGIEYYKGKPIVYSLGNFIFGSSIPKTALLQAEWDGRETKLSLIPGVSSAGYTRMLQTQDETREFYEYMTGISYGVAVNENGQVSETE
ncbi:CapA family protein [Enterocloster alcoholdehydrogenati]|uniref:CapA family protein n=1 Tax=Enterocloster alcoholdehydrogenati TaxID=2547410 RepID=A0ABQ0B0B6_9FIRM